MEDPYKKAKTEMATSNQEPKPDVEKDEPKPETEQLKEDSIKEDIKPLTE